MRLPRPQLLPLTLVITLAFATIPSSVFSNELGNKRAITIQAGDFGYTPSIIQVEHGDEITIELVSTDVAHGIQIDAYDVSLTAVPGEPRTITFIADKVGSFRMRCTVSCGALHPFMIGKLIVGGNAWFVKGIYLLLLSIFAYAFTLWFRQKGIPS